MKDFKVIEVKRSIFEDNNADADRLREQLKSEGTFLLNLMSSPGAGKTTTLKRTINMLKDEINIGVMEADIDSDVDAQAITDTGVRAIQIHTGGMCHLDADMTRQGINEFVVLINKCDTLSVFDDFSKKDVEERIHNLNPNAKVFFVSAKTGEGFEQWTDWLKNELKIYSK